MTDQFYPCKESNSSEDEMYENARSSTPPNKTATVVTQQSNEEVINSLIKEQTGLSLDENSDEENAHALDANEEQGLDVTSDEETRQEYEKHLTAEELLENKNKAVKFKTEGNQEFKDEDYTNSITSYTNGLDICPLAETDDRSILFGNRAAAHIQLGNKTNAIDDCTESLKLNGKYLKVLIRYDEICWLLKFSFYYFFILFYRRAKLYEETDKLDESLEDYKQILEIDSSYTDAKAALVRLPQKIEERNERLKTEMFGKLKDLGNMILKPFGMSTNNFQMVQDPNSGGYSFSYNPSK